LLTKGQLKHVQIISNSFHALGKLKAPLAGYGKRVNYPFPLLIYEERNDDRDVQMKDMRKEGEAMAEW
jgi:hypothetical protein